MTTVTFTLPAAEEEDSALPARTGWRQGRTPVLTATEYRLLHALILDAGGVATCETLIRRVWGDKDGGNVAALRSAVAKLRRKLGDDARKPRYVIGARGLGYRMPEPDGL